MTLTRRGFLTGILALGAAPAFVGATNPTIWVPRSIATRPADILTGPFMEFSQEVGYSWAGDGLLISDTIPGAARNVTISKGGQFTCEFNPGTLPPEYANTANALLNNGQFQVCSFKVCK